MDTEIDQHQHLILFFQYPLYKHQKNTSDGIYKQLNRNANSITSYRVVR